MIFQEVPKEKWPNSKGKAPEKVWFNKQYLVQLLDERGNLRLTINRVHAKIVKGKPIWEDGITWDELQEIKNSVGYSDYWAVEAYPPVKDVVNVANMRHLWLLKEPPEYGWKK